MNHSRLPFASSASAVSESGIGCVAIAVVLLAVLLEACSDDTPTDPGEGDAPALAEMMGDDSTQVVIEPHWLTLDTIGVSDKLAATVLDADGDTIDGATVTWEAADTAIATVDSAGAVTSVDFGKTKVTATYDSATAWATVEVAKPLTDREILEIFYEATEGDDWDDNTNWLSDEDLDDWYGVRADRGRVKGLSLNDNNLVGTIPPELGGLNGLFNLLLSHNRLAGPIPPELSKFEILRDMYLNGNAEISGRLPVELGYMGGLEYFVVDETSLSGPVPLTFANLDLATFYFDKDGVCIPAALKAWMDSIPWKEDNYEVCTNQIVINPPSLYLEVHAPGDTVRLAAAVINAAGDTVRDAAITWSSADTAIAAVDSTGLVTTVDYGTVGITATFDSLADTARVEIVFKLSNRQVLDSLYQVTGGENWTYTTNWLGDRPLSEWYGVETSDSGEVVGLALGSNNLIGSIPGFLAELDSLVTLDLGGNALAGEIPRGLGELRRLRRLLLNGNALEGLLPTALGSSAGLRYLHIADNKLNGVVPGPFADLKLDTLYAAGSGVCVPPSLGEWFEGIEQTDSAAHCVASINIEVVDRPSLSFYAIGETGDLSATYVSAEGDTIYNVPATWSSGDAAVVSVSAAGRVAAVGDGEAEVTATYDSTTGTIAAKVALPEDDRDVLEILYDLARGGGWTDATNWLTEEPLSKWAGVETDDGGRVVELSLRGNNLRGPVHASIGLLDQLVTLDLSRNRVTGSIPADFGNLTRLRDLTLSVNGFVGRLPAALGSLDDLRTISVTGTSLSGLVPVSFADLDLDSFLVNGTDVCVPPSLAEWLDSIAETDDPAECASQVLVEPSSLTFDARGDTARLSATVIDAEGDVEEDAEVTWKSGNTRVARVDTTGLVTARASGVTDVTAMYDFGDRAASADVAVKLPGGDRVALEAFYRATGGDDWTNNTNWLSDRPLGEWYGVDSTASGRVRHLRLRSNNLTGQIPAAIGLLDTLFILDLEDNGIGATIPPAIGRLQRLRDLDLGDTGLEGALPPSMGNMTGLEYLSLDHTALTGPLPPTFTHLTLDQFHHDGTGLCVPRSMMEWYESLGNSDPLPCIPETSDREVLVTFYDATGGSDWGRNRNWLSRKSINTWYGIVTDGEGYVTEIKLVENNLAGPIPPEFGSLSRLEVVEMYHNALSGKIPPELGNLAGLVRLGLYDNRLEGAIPPELGNLPGLRDFWLSENQLTGPIPPELGNLPAVEDFGVQNNQLTGPIPPEFGQLSSLVLLSFRNNDLSGPIPPEIGELSSLKLFDASMNRFSGSIPAEFGKLAMLERLGLFKSGLTGPIPPELGNLPGLKDLWLSGNQLDGSLPAELGNLESLTVLTLHDNRLEGPLPPELGSLSKLEILWLMDNQITGPLPPELGKLEGLKDLNLRNNRVDGPIPSELGNLRILEWLTLADNRLSGIIPPELGKLSNLLRLSLYENELTEAIPPELGNLSSLRDFWLGDNQLTGPIPPELARLTTVEDFSVRENNLSGPIPPEFGRMSSLTRLELHTNNFSGPLPPEIGDLGNLEDLRLQDNPDLEGLLPRSVMNLPLGHLDIGGTDLCPQLDAEFREWLDGIGKAYGLKCPATQIERFALVELYDRTGGDDWTNNDGWDTDSDMGGWYGVTVGDSLVLQLRLPNNGLVGPLPPEIGSLRALETLDLAENDLNVNGELPASITSMGALDTIRVSGNADMEGPLPFRMIDLEDLKALLYADTDLCASPSKTFQEWIDSLDVTDGATCDNPDEVRLSLPIVYLTQAIQRPAGDVPLISNRKALLRVFLVSDQDAFFEPEVFATFTRKGREVHRVVMLSEQDRLATFAGERSLLKSYNAVIPAKYIANGTGFVIVADSAEVVPRAPGSQTRFPETGTAALDVIEVPPFELTVVPVLNADEPDSSIFEWTDNVDDDSEEVGLLKYSFPFGEFTATSWDTAYVTSLDMTDEDNTWSVLLEVEKVYKSAEATGYWYAAADSEKGYVRGIARINGWVSFGKPWDTELAHEVGHTLDLLHAPCGGALGTDPDFPYANGSIGVWGYDFRDGSLVSPRSRRDIMGYCYEKGWLSDYYFDKVIDVREEKEGEDPRKDMAGAGHKGQMLVLWGGVLNGELQIEPVHPMYTTATLPRETGPYSLQGITRNGDIEFSLSFTPGEDVFGNRYFFFTIPIKQDWEDSLERITLTGPEGEVAVDNSDPRSLTVVTDPSTGRIRAILRDWDRRLPAALGDTSGLEAVTTRGIVAAVRAR